MAVRATLIGIETNCKDVERGAQAQSIYHEDDDDDDEQA
jgi:hypothetical protein